MPRPPGVPAAKWGLPSACLLIVACALLVTLPLFRNGPSCGHDFDFHLQSWLAACASWRSWLEASQSIASWFARVYPAWIPAANYGAGEPRFVFYPPFSWMLGGGLGSILPWPWVPQAFTAVALAGCGISFTLMARQWVSTTIATGFGCLYLAGPYLLFVAYERTAYGELLGAMAMPLVLRYSLGLRHGPYLDSDLNSNLNSNLDSDLDSVPELGHGRSSGYDLGQQLPVLPLSLTIAFLWLVNAPAAVMGCYLLGLCALTVTIWTRTLAPAARALLALALGTGLAGVYVVPAWYEQRWVEIGRVTGPGMRVEDSFLFGRTGEPFHDQVLRSASWISLLVLGTGLLCTGICWLVLRPAARAKMADPAAADSRSRLVLFLASAMLLLLLLLLPGSEAAWRWAPELRFLQFPWRWLLAGSVLATLSGALAADSLLKRQSPVAGRTPRTIYAGGFAAALCLAAWAAGQTAQHRFGQFCDEQDNVQAQEALLSPSTGSADSDRGSALEDFTTPGFAGTDEYTPAGADNGEIQQGLPAVRILAAPGDDEGDDSKNPNPDWQRSEQSSCQGRAEIQAWSAEEKRLTVIARAPCFAVLRLMDYPAWRIVEAGKLLSRRPHREDGLLTVPVAAGTTKIEIHYQATPDVYAGRALSLFSLAALGWLGWRQRRLRQSNRERPRSNESASYAHLE